MLIEKNRAFNLVVSYLLNKPIFKNERFDSLNRRKLIAFFIVNYNKSSYFELIEQKTEIGTAFVVKAMKIEKDIYFTYKVFCIDSENVTDYSTW